MYWAFVFIFGLGDKKTSAIGKIFALTGDDDTRAACLSGLYRINSSSAKKQLLAIYKDTEVGEHWRTACARYLKLALEEGQRISSRDAEVIAGITSN